MTQEEKQLLSTDLCARLPHGMYAEVEIWNGEKVPKKVYGYNLGYFRCDGFDYDIDEIKPYLKPMSSMTEEERKEFIYYASYEIEESVNGRHYEYYLKDGVRTPEEPTCNYDAIDWLNAHHFVYRGLIEKGLALEAPEGMYN